MALHLVAAEDEVPTPVQVSADPPEPVIVDLSEDASSDHAPDPQNAQSLPVAEVPVLPAPEASQPFFADSPSADVLEMLGAR
ncbi:unnamed protein product [Ilex paraguariensis]|uniref:Uncharacterized protein n=1 Tax=Ilex paraguariensis TaxID=185542 RepID=A0ABC8TQC7_9AQUA